LLGRVVTASGPGAALDPAERMRRAYALGGMVDPYMSGLYLSRDDGIIAVSGDAGAVVDTLTMIWKKGMQP